MNIPHLFSILSFATCAQLATVADAVAANEQDKPQHPESSEAPSPVMTDTEVALSQYRVTLPKDWKRVDGQQGSEAHRFEKPGREGGPAEIVFLLSLESPDGKTNTTYLASNSPADRDNVLVALKAKYPESQIFHEVDCEFIVLFHNNKVGEKVAMVSAEYKGLMGVVLQLLIRCPADTSNTSVLDLVRSRLKAVKIKSELNR